MLPWTLWSTRRIPTHARTWITGTASSQRSPSTTGTKSGAAMMRPAIAGIVTAARIRVTRIQSDPMRAGSSWILENAGKRTWRTGSPIFVRG